MVRSPDQGGLTGSGTGTGPGCGAGTGTIPGPGPCGPGGGGAQPAKTNVTSRTPNSASALHCVRMRSGSDWDSGVVNQVAFILISPFVAPAPHKGTVTTLSLVRDKNDCAWGECPKSEFQSYRSGESYSTLSKTPCPGASQTYSPSNGSSVPEYGEICMSRLGGLRN